MSRLGEPVLFQVPFEGAVYHMLWRAESEACPFSILTVQGPRHAQDDATEERFWEQVRLAWMDVEFEEVDDATEG